LNQLRYERPERGTLKSGMIHPLVEAPAGAGDERDMTAFVKFYEKHLLDDRDRNLEHAFQIPNS
jgi:hypothetical protein